MPGASALGLLALHTTAAAICGIHLGPWLVGRWLGWILPALGETPSGLAADYYLQHLEVVSIFPALVVGYISSRYLPMMAAWAWILPTTIICYKLSMFHDPHGSVLATDHWARFSYYFVIERFIPTFYNFRGSDPSRVAAQLTAIAPFYSGIAYSIGTLTPKVLQRIRENLLGSRSLKLSVQKRPVLLR